jgi:thiol:disulfide interchange protein DsbD
MNELVQSLKIYLETAPLMAYIIIFIGGILTSFEPCIYTMLPVTVAFIASQSGGSKLKGFFLSVIYVLGIAITYSTLGAVAALTGTLFGKISSTPLTNLIMGNVCILLGLSMFDIFTIKVPSFISNLQSKRIGKGFIAIFFLGLVSGFVVGPCAGAILGVALTYVATKQNVLFGITLLFTFSMGMGVLLIIVGTFAGFLMALPKVGPWMDKIRKALGGFLIIIGEYFIYLSGKLSI